MNFRITVPISKKNHMVINLINLWTCYIETDILPKLNSLAYEVSMSFCLFSSLFKAHVCIWGIGMQMPGHTCRGQGTTLSISSWLSTSRQGLWFFRLAHWWSYGDSRVPSPTCSSSCVVYRCLPLSAALPGSGDPNTGVVTYTANTFSRWAISPAWCYFLLIFFISLSPITVLNFTGCFF